MCLLNCSLYYSAQPIQPIQTKCICSNDKCEIYRVFDQFWLVSPHAETTYDHRVNPMYVLLYKLVVKNKKNIPKKWINRSQRIKCEWHFFNPKYLI